jgi:integrase
MWQAAGRMDRGPYGDLVRILILTGQRLSQAATMQRSEIDPAKGLWITPASKMKMDEPHATPLTPAAVAILRKLLDRPSHRNGYVFSTTGGNKPFSGFSKAKKKLDALIEEIRIEEAGDSVIESMPAWTLHDLRRTVRSNLPALGVSDVVAEEILAHAKSGIEAVYDLYSYLPEKRNALTKWAEHLQAIVNPAPGTPAADENNVVSFRGTG